MLAASRTDPTIAVKTLNRVLGMVSLRVRRVSGRAFFNYERNDAQEI
jgi:hypothetical protein